MPACLQLFRVVFLLLCIRVATAERQQGCIFTTVFAPLDAKLQRLAAEMNFLMSADTDGREKVNPGEEAPSFTDKSGLCVSAAPSGEGRNCRTILNKPVFVFPIHFAL